MSMDDVFKRSHERYLKLKELGGDRLHWFLCDLDIYTNDPEINEKLFSGWIEPDGTFHGVAFGKHCQYAGIILGKTEDELERLGWLKTCEQRNKIYFAGAVYGHDITAKQRRVIKAKGFDIRTDLRET